MKKEEKAGKRIYFTSEEQNDIASREKDNIGEKQYICLATQENLKSNPSPTKIYIDLHLNPQQAKFSGNHKSYLSKTDNASSNMSQDEE